MNSRSKKSSKSCIERERSKPSGTRQRVSKPICAPESSLLKGRDVRRTRQKSIPIGLTSLAIGGRSNFLDDDGNELTEGQWANEMFGSDFVE